MQWGTFLVKNVNVTTMSFFMSGDLTGLCLFMSKFQMFFFQNGAHFSGFQIPFKSETFANQSLFNRALRSGENALKQDK